MNIIRRRKHHVIPYLSANENRTDNECADRLSALLENISQLPVDALFLSKLLNFRFKYA